jgi:hypothetical protein
LRGTSKRGDWNRWIRAILAILWTGRWMKAGYILIHSPKSLTFDCCA